MLITLDANKIAVRALNYWRPLYIPTYVGLRLLLNQLSGIPIEQFLNDVLRRKILSRQLPRYRRFAQFKARLPSGDVELREFFAASPTSALAEAFTLQVLSKVKALANRPNVYSYRWPQRDAEGRFFSYFFSGYRERRDKVTELLHKNSRYVVAVYDIRRFYPSINKSAIIERLYSYIATLEDKVLSSFVRATSEQIMDIPTNGIPIGPALSHVFANIAMEKVDYYMSSFLEDRYLRYVDDIFLVLLPGEIDDTQSKLEDLVHEEGFTLHDEKFDVVTKEEWLNSLPTSKEEQLYKRFETFIQRIKLFLWLKPKRFQTLQEKFGDLGSSLPLRKFFVDAQYGRFHRFMRGVFRTTKWGRQEILQLHEESEGSLLTEAMQLRKAFQFTAEQLTNTDLPQIGMARRSMMQRVRYLLNRLLYLVPINEFPLLISLAPNIDELYEYRSLVQAIIEKQLALIVNMPGATASTFSSICQQQKFRLSPYDKELLNSEGALDSLCILATFGILEPPLAWLKTLPKLDEKMVRSCMLSIPEQRVLDDHSYEDEVTSLQLGEKPDRIREIFNSRYSDLEAINLDGLFLTRYGYA